ncbi:nucleoside triphosphate pyrophosphatase [Neomegalonema sp.]|uniref:Maf family protein n=1 Tax=Neomegalonema sp. TaxID=2039713 RepID=UPI00260D2549|nr:nucleoside triphosphate pyrophosphatase [Neomegalonema sp.]MDD2867105.1 Maf family protein [Neomegalonema sp.]
MILLASGSEARARMLRAAGVEVHARRAAVDEEAVTASLRAEGVGPRDLADALAEMKAMRVGGSAPPGLLTLGADQTLAFGERVHGKPESLKAARAQLLELRGESHTLFSAAVIVENGAPVWRHVGVAQLRMRPFSEKFLDAYLEAEGEAILGCAGAYRIEGPGAQLFSRVTGDHFTIQGLPLLEILGYLRARGILTE